jgi:hypothetical protein
MSREKKILLASAGLQIVVAVAKSGAKSPDELLELGNLAVVLVAWIRR